MLKRVLILILILSAVSAFAQRHITQCCDGVITFIENKNQWDDHIRYKVELTSASIFLEDDGITYFFEDRQGVENILSYKLNPQLHESPEPPSLLVDYHAYKVHFKGANKKPLTTAYHPSEDYINYYIGNDKSRWASKVRKYQKVRYHELYDNIDLAFYSQGHKLKYDFIVSPDGNPNKIQMAYKGHDNIRISSRGHLIIKTSINEITELKPFSYQIIDGDTVEVSSRYRLNDNTLSFHFPRGYNENYALVIDPTLIFSTYTGSTTDNWGYTATYDYEGYVYAAGISMGMGYPFTTGAFQQTFGGPYCDISITKFDTTGASLIYSTHLGGNGPEIPHSIFVNNNNELFVFGTTGSSDFPVTPNAYDTTFKGGTPYVMTHVINYTQGSDIIVTRFNADGTALLASTYLGGTGNDGLSSAPPLRYNYADEARGEVFLDDNNNCWIVSSTQSPDFPVTSNAFQQTFGGGLQDGLIVKMDNDLSTLIWSSFLGGSGNDAIYSITIDGSDGHVYVAGGTSSQNFPVTPNALQPVYNGGVCDGFIAKIHKNGNNIIHSTYYGSNAYDQIYFVERDKLGYIYVYGQTEALGNTYIHNALWATPDGGQFISKLGAQLDTLIWSTAFGTGGGGPDISPTAFLVDLCNNIYLSGWGGTVNQFGGTSGLPITIDAYQSTTNNSDFYLLVMTDDASSLVYATYFGGAVSNDHVDGGTSRFDKKGIIYQSMCAGCGGHSDTPTTPGAWSQTNNSLNCNNAVFKMDFGLPVTIADFNVPPILCAPATINFNNTSTTSGSSGITAIWNFGDGTQSTDYHPTHTYDSSGIYQVQLIVSDTGSCNFTDTIVKQIVVLSNTVDTLPADTICYGDFTQIGVPPLPDPNTTYQWFPATGLSSTTVPNPIASPLASTNYMLLIDNGVCTDTLYKRVEVDDLSVFAGNDTTVCDGSLTLTATANQSVNYYLWSSQSNFSDTLNAFPTSNQLIFSISSSGIYYVQVSNNNCTATDSIYITVSEVNINTAPDATICMGDTVPLGVTNLNPSSPLSYTWEPTSSIVSGSNTANPVVNPQTNTTYTVTATDNYGCEATAQVTVNVIEILAATQSANVLCYQDCNGSANILPSGGGAPYTYLWSNGQTTQQVQNLCAGSYNVTVTDNNGCEVVEQVTIYEPPELTVVVTDTIHVTCNGICDGEITVSGNGGTPPYSYSWITGQNTPHITGLCAGTYTVTVTDNNNCVSVLPVSIQDTSTFDAAASITQASCYGYCDGEAEAYGIGGLPPYSYQWVTGNQTQQVGQLCAGVYNVTVTDDQNCIRNVYITVTEPDDITVNSQVINPPSCYGYCDGAADLSIAGGTTPYNVIWSSGSTGASVTDLCGGTHTFTVTDYNNCTYIDSLHLDEPTPLELEISASTVPCVEVCIGTGNVSATGSTPPYTYVWSDGQTGSSASNLCAGINSVTVTDANNCSEVIQVMVNDSSVVPPEFTITAEKDTIYNGQSTQLLSTPLQNFTYNWEPPYDLDNPNIPNPVASPSATTTFILFLTDQWGCVYTDTITIYVKDVFCDDSNIFVPNAFSPNDDNFNDVFYVRGAVIDEIYLTIFNRWGEQVFESRSLSQGWDGTYKGRMSEPGVYIYYLEVLCIDEQEFFKKGNVTLLR